MKNLKFFITEAKAHKFKKGDKVKIKDEWKDDPSPEYDFTYELIEKPDGGRVKIKAIDSKLSVIPVEVVKLDWLVPA
jgi:hypothetical protein